jgi:bifunctional DNase/RNase
MVQVEIINVILSEKGFVVVLKSVEDDRALPIFIGEQEARSIIVALSNTLPARPLSHDLMKNILLALECEPVRVIVNDLIDDTFYGTIILNHNGHELSIDSRPSDAIALAVRTETPIFVARKVIDEAGVVLPEETAAALEANAAETTSETPSASTNTLDNLKKQLQAAVQSEQYELAAKLRDSIQKFSADN